MRRKEAFSFTYFHDHCRSSMASAFPTLDDLPDAMARALDRLGTTFAADPTPSERLALLKPLFDAETCGCRTRPFC